MPKKPQSDNNHHHVAAQIHGLPTGGVPTLPNDPTKYLNGLGAWSTPAGGSSHARAHSITSVLDHTDWPATVTTTELGYLANVTSDIQAQINAIGGGTGGGNSYFPSGW